MSHSRNGLIWGVVLLAFGAFVLALVDKGIPDRSRLTEVLGQLKSLDKATSKGGGISAVRFSLATDQRDFHYISKSGQIDAVWNAMQQAGHSEIGLLIDSADSHSPPFENRSFYTAYEIRIGGNLIRSYPQIAESWDGDNFVGELLGYGASLIGVALIVVPFLMRRRRAWCFKRGAPPASFDG
ncbi:hypothetical protein AZOA_16600 [Azoarcus sp. Aa7]|nr:hypothetical protein [Azoarcus sp. Aa7]